MTQRELAEKVGISRNSIVRIETGCFGEDAGISSKTLAGLLRALKLRDRLLILKYERNPYYDPTSDNNDRVSEIQKYRAEQAELRLLEGE